MRFRKFGSTGWSVSEIGLGTYPTSGHWGGADDAESLKVIEKAYQLGVNFFDTADVYGLGNTEKLIAQALSSNGVRKDVFIASKGGRDFYSEPPKIQRNFSPSYLDSALDKSLERLQTDYIDVYQLHGPDVDTIKQGEVFTFLEAAKKDGRIRATGLSLYTLEEVREALNYEVVDSIQFIFNMLSPHLALDALKLCIDKGVAFIAREPLAQGLLTGKYSVDVEFPSDDHRAKKWDKEFLERNLSIVDQIAFLKNDERTLPQVALRFVLTYQKVSIVIPGARNLTQLQDNLGTENIEPFSSDEWEKILEIIKV